MSGYVFLPREVAEHLADWHNKQPCGGGMDSYDEVIFAALVDALHPPGCDCPESDNEWHAERWKPSA